MKKAVLIIIISLLLVGCNNRTTTDQNKKEESNQDQVANNIIVIPDVIKLDKETAKTKLEELGFKVEFVYEDNAEYNKDETIKTTPNIGSKQSKGATIKVHIAKENNLFTVEDYVGKNYLVAKSSLEQNGIRVIIEKTNIIDDLYEENIVANQSIVAGEKINKGETITLYIPDVISTYPDFTTGYTVSEVGEFCDKHGVSLKVESVDNNTGKIIYQSREAGSKIIKGTTLTIKVE